MDATAEEFMVMLERLAGQGRVPVEDLTHPDDPRLHIETPEGGIRTARKPDRVYKEGSSRRRQWYWKPYMLEEERDYNPGVEHKHAIVVTKREE